MHLEVIEDNRHAFDLLGCGHTQIKIVRLSGKGGGAISIVKTKKAENEKLILQRIKKEVLKMRI